MLRSSRTQALALAALIIAVAATGSAARQYLNSGGSGTVSTGVVPEVGDAAVSDANPLPVKLPSGGAGIPTSPATITRSAVVITLPANTATQIATAGLKSFFAQVQGSNPVIVGYDNTVCTGTGATIAAANGATPGQSTNEYPASTTAYWACSVAGSSVVVIRGQ